MSRIFIFLVLCFIFNKNIICDEVAPGVDQGTQDAKGQQTDEHKEEPVQHVNQNQVTTVTNVQNEDSIDNKETGKVERTSDVVTDEKLPPSDIKVAVPEVDGENTQQGAGDDNTQPKVDNDYTQKAVGEVTPERDGNIRPGGEVTKNEAPEEKDRLFTPVKSALLKKYKGIKVEGICGEYIQMNFIPHFTFLLDTKSSKLVLDQKFAGAEQIDIQFAGQCLKTQTFKIVIKLKDNILIIKWKVNKGTDEGEAHKETKKFKVPTLERPVTAIQIHTSKGGDIAIESKNYTLKNVINEKCDIITSDCFLSGHYDIEKCFHCAALVRQENDCLNFVSNEGKEEFEKSIIAVTQDEVDPLEHELKLVIDYLLKRFFKKNNKNNKRVIIGENELDDELKEELKKYCNILKEIDTNGVLEGNELGDEVEVFRNLREFLKKNFSKDNIKLRTKLKNPIICTKNVEQWVLDRRGLKLSDSSYHEELEAASVEEGAEEENEPENTFSEDINKADDETVIDLTKKVKLLSPYYVKNKYCNDEYCDRWKDKTSCFSKIEIEDQKTCGICWIFASKLHLETIRCIRGHGHHRSSPLYVANCSERQDRCGEGSDPFEFLSILVKKQFLPLESDYPYSHTKGNNPCPNVKSNWINLWGETEVVTPKNKAPLSALTGAYFYRSSLYKSNFSVFIKLVKSHIQSKGSVIAYVKTQGVLGYDINGEKVEQLCGMGDPDHALNIVGYGNYINYKGEKKSYWLIRNSWGTSWGDEGYLKVDMHGPPYCYENFIHTVVAFRLNLGMIQIPKPNPIVNPFRIFVKNSPFFYHQLYYKNFDQQKFQLSQREKVDQQAKDKKKINHLDAINNVNDKNSENDMDNDQTVYAEEEDDTNDEEIIMEANSSQEEIKHSLKDVKTKEIRTNVVVYENEGDMSNVYSCSRVYSVDRAKDEECKKFCREHFDECKDHYLPGYCLTKLKEDNECFFCPV